MRRIRMKGLTILAVLTVGALVASTASAEEFIYSKEGNLRGHSLSVQTFKLGKAIIECHDTISGSVQRFDFDQTPPLAVTYTGCSTQTLGDGTTVGLAHYVFFAPPAAGMDIENSFTSKNTGLGPVKCTVTVAADQSLGGKAGEVEYQNKSGKIVVKTKITGISYEVIESESMSFCGEVGAKGTNGTYTGSNEIELEDGTIEIQ